MSSTIPSRDGQRLAPVMPLEAYRTYQVLTPLASHFRAATCDEVDCDAQARGWVTRVDERTELGQRQAHYIRHQSGRAFREERDPAGLTCFTFQPGQRCFQQHRARLDRPGIFVRRDGDWRGNPTGQVVRHASAADWQEDFAEHQDRLADRLRQG
jgi:hypothetical protein